MMTKVDLEGVSGLTLLETGANFVRKTIQDGISSTGRTLAHVSVMTKQTAVGAASVTRKVVYNLLSTLLTVVLVVSASLFMYGTFYYAYMPKEIHEVDVNFQFDSCVDTMGMCSFPNASVNLDGRRQRLMTGQPYSINLLLEVPDSPTNQALGMFMSCLHIQTKDMKKIGQTCKSNILEYRSDLLRVMETLVFSPFLLMGSTTQRQWINVNYFTEFMDDPHSPATEISLVLRSKFVQVYSASLQVHAEFAGLRHIMFHHPIISTVVGVSSNMFILAVIILISWSRFFVPEVDADSGLEGEVEDRDDLSEAGDVVPIVETDVETEVLEELASTSQEVAST